MDDIQAKKEFEAFRKEIEAKLEKRKGSEKEETGNDLLKGLNEKQKEAVLENSAPLLVFAGAGSGKTRVVTTKIAYCIKELGIPSWQILAVTFTNRACKEMKERVQVLLPEIEPKDLCIRTFHSFGAMLLRYYSQEIGLDSNFKIYDDEDSATLLTQIYPDSKKKDMKIVAHRISKAKDMMKGPSEFKKEGEFYQQYTRYERALRNTGNVDFADLILLPIKLLNESSEVLKKVQYRYKVILVDEYQDSNISQFALMKKLVGPDNFICVVGDDDQSIYRFRGAEVKNILSFEDHFQGTKVVKLEQNYRSTKSILSVASSIISKNIIRAKKTLYSNREDGKKPTLVYVEDERVEASTIARIIQKDNNFEGSAILYRTNAQSQVFESLFNRIGIPYKIVGALRFYDREEIKDAVALLSFLINPRDSISFSRIIAKGSRGVGPTSVKKILEKASDRDLDLISACKSCIESGDLKGKAKTGCEKFMKTFDGLVDLVGKETNPVLIEKVMDEFGLTSYYIKRDSDEGNIDNKRVKNLEELVNIFSREEFSEGVDGINQFFEEAALDPTQMAKDENRNKSGVTLITMHNTKGLEFDRVFIVGLEENLIPGRNSESNEELEEERRIFYVAITRAKNELWMTSAKSRRQWGHTEFQRPSRFLNDIPKELINLKADNAPKPSYNQNVKTNYNSSYSQKPKEKPFVAVERKNKIDFASGDRIESSSYGLGNVTSVRKIGCRMVMDVTFDSGRKSCFACDRVNFTKK